jgi:hypothetical protein
MTEAEWLALRDPTTAVMFLDGKGQDRKLRLFAVACCRHGLQCMIDTRCRKAVEIAELYADGLATEEERRLCRLQIDPVWGESTAFAAWASDHSVNAMAICEQQRQTYVNHLHLLHDIFGNPFRPVTINPAWLTLKVTTLAQAIYNDRGFDKMPALADALEEAGCDNQDVLSHCRGPGPHVKGCWVVDLVLAKE